MAGGNKKIEEKVYRGRSMREAAEKKIDESPGISPELATQTPEELIHDLQVHQVELETQAEELRRTHLALEESRDKYLDLYEFAPVGYLTLTYNAMITEVNLPAATLLGVERNKLERTRFRPFISPPDLDLWDRYFMAVLVQDTKRTCNLMLKRGNGSTFPARLESVRLTGINDIATKVRVAIINISDIRLAEEALHESEEKFHSLYVHMIDGAALHQITCNEQGVPVDYVIIETNPAFERLLGISRDMVIGKTSRDAYGVDEPPYLDIYERVARTGESKIFETYFPPMDKYFSISVYSPVKGRFATIFNDITDRRRTEQRQELALTIFQILNSSPHEDDSIRKILHSIKQSTGIEAVGIRLKKGEDYPYYETSGFPDKFVESERSLCGRDSSGNIKRDENDQVILECMCGNIICGRTDPHYQFFTTGGSFWSNGTSALLASTTEEERQATTRNRCNGEGFESVALIPLRSQDKIIGLIQLNDRRKNMFALEMIQFFEGLGNAIGVALDRKRAEEVLGDVNRKLTLLSSITRHDINNQLMSVNGFLGLLHKKVPDPDLADYFNRITKASDRISAMIRFTREYEQIGANAPAWQDCHILVDNAAKDAPLGELTVKNNLPAGMKVFSDPLIGKVFYNLMDNAARHGGGEITTIQFSFKEQNGEGLMICENDGIGIPTDEKVKIFDRGFGKNTGLGLFLSREILAITGILITETGEPGKGARFVMMVPNGMWRLAGTED